jgi:hypothetical protein
MVKRSDDAPAVFLSTLAVRCIFDISSTYLINSAEGDNPRPRPKGSDTNSTRSADFSRILVINVWRIDPPVRG